MKNETLRPFIIIPYLEAFPNGNETLILVMDKQWAYKLSHDQENCSKSKK